MRTTTRRPGGAPGTRTGAARRLAARWVGTAAAVTLVAVGVAAPVQAAGTDGTYDVEIRVEGRGGTVTGAGSYEAGETVDLTATPGRGHVWGGWTSPELGWIGARVGSFTMPEQDVVLETSFRKAIKPLKDVYRDYFDVGNIWSHPGTYEQGSPASETIAKHYSVMTAENAMKPDQLLPNDNIDPETGAFTFTFAQADAFVDETLARGMKVHGHVLVWHGQSPARLNSGTTGGTRAQARANMERYITEVLTHFDGRAVSWDVVNEAFVDGLAEFDPATQDWRDFLRGGPNGGFSRWYTAYANGADTAAGEHPADFLYDAFVFARTADPDMRLEYNDFNVFQSEGKAQAIIAMATDLNARYAAEHPEDPRPLVEAIGMQSHNYINQTPAFACSSNTRLPQLVDDAAAEWQPGACSDEASVERSIQLITEAGFEVSISELDLQVWEAWNGQPEGDDRAAYRDLTDPSVADRISREGFTYWVGKIENRAELERIQAQRFAEYFAVYKTYATDIDRVTFWGLNDQLSWRSTHNPLILNSDFSEKLAAVAVADPERWLGIRGHLGDTSKLQEAVDQAEVLDLRGHTYTGKSVGAVRKALGKATSVLAKGAPQAKVDEATAALLDAIAALEPKGPKGPKPPKAPKPPHGPHR
ncbi:endo-1,4-beta-xylanase [Cellulomonas sp. zg-ZUI22]|uniref:endo-1,4-beta-xylanase n=1 Tax=Cellulomonas sp. zg-ZUI22 TaxID=2816955 RepID=UPI001A951532|nr:endo-1,4-beta-xylanase [Cellulomonas sp. zg-ZUI22]MBO0901162.1 endo-1,4-beta-xylanase [Cellulomonas sp. zg-ZUI22]